MESSRNSINKCITYAGPAATYWRRRPLGAPTPSGGPYPLRAPLPPTPSGRPYPRRAPLPPPGSTVLGKFPSPSPGTRQNPVSKPLLIYMHKLQHVQ